MKTIISGISQTVGTKRFPSSSWSGQFWSQNGVLLAGPDVVQTGSGKYFVAMTWALIDGTEWFYAYGPASDFNTANNLLNEMQNGLGQTGWLQFAGEFYNFVLRPQLKTKQPEANADSWLAEN